MEKNNEPTTESVNKKIVSVSHKKLEPLYSIAQLADSFQVFGTTRAIVACALKLTGKDSFTMSEAQKIINAFKNKR